MKSTMKPRKQKLFTADRVYFGETLKLRVRRVPNQPENKILEGSRGNLTIHHKGSIERINQIIERYKEKFNVEVEYAKV